MAAPASRRSNAGHPDSAALVQGDAIPGRAGEPILVVDAIDPLPTETAVRPGDDGFALRLLERRDDVGLVFLQALADLMRVEVSALVRCRPTVPLPIEPG